MSSHCAGRTRVVLHYVAASVMFAMGMVRAIADPPGETCSNPIVIPSLPYATINDSCLFSNQYNAACPYAGGGSPDVVYQYTTGPSPVNVTISLCNDATDYDTKLYVFQGDCTGAALYCNDDSCSTPSFPDEWVSRLDCVALQALTTYFIVVDGYASASCGGYSMTIDGCYPCIECPIGGVQELEPCGQNANGGCNMATPAFEPIACGEIKCGTAWFDGSIRDTDWYELNLASPARITLTGIAVFDLKLAVITPPCPGALPIAEVLADACAPASVTTDCLQSGAYYIWAGPQFGYPVVCPAAYYIHVTCEPCVAGACCVQTYECRFVDAAECATLGGVYQGDFISCATNPCPLPPGDSCGNPLLIGALPFATSGSTCGPFHNDYDSICPYGGSVAPDVVYAYAPILSQTVSVDLCASLYDTKVYIFEDDCASPPLVCNDDACGASGYRSKIESVALRAGRSYFIVVDGYSDSCGGYELSISPLACLGDADCGGTVDFFDIDPFVAKLGCPDSGPSCNDGCPWQACDVDQDGDVDFFDIDPFVARLGSVCP